MYKIVLRSDMTNESTNCSQSLEESTKAAVKVREEESDVGVMRRDTPPSLTTTQRERSDNHIPDIELLDSLAQLDNLTEEFVA